ncbi:MAG: dTDP-glucose 4,6-dehydratase [Steroidobacteraceae bacterium]
MSALPEMRFAASGGPLLVTGGAGFIGGNFVLGSVAAGQCVVNLDALTYAGNLDTLAPVQDHPGHVFVHGNIGDAGTVARLLREHRPRAVINFAAETHVDRSIDGPAQFIQTNVVGTLTLLEAARDHWSTLPGIERDDFRFIHVSTDEVYGSLGDSGHFTEASPYAPNSPYAASKAASDHLVRAFNRTYGLPTIVTHCSNNYGPYQFPEKLIPLMILKAVAGEGLPVYGDGLNVRDWLHVVDHCSAIARVLDAGRVGETYNIGGNSERTNVALVRSLCRLLDDEAPRVDGSRHEASIRFVEDRPGHDRRYAIDGSRMRDELGWNPSIGLEDGLRRTLRWYLENGEWVRRVQTGGYRGERLGLTT